MEHWWTSLEVARGLKNQPKWLNSSSKKSLKNPEKHLKNQGSFISRLQEQIIIFSDKKKKLMILWMCFLKWLITDQKFFKECDFFLKRIETIPFTGKSLLAPYFFNGHLVARNSSRRFGWKWIYKIWTILFSFFSFIQKRCFSNYILPPQKAICFGQYYAVL